MKKFRFTLEAVRTVRQRLEQKALEHYAQCLAARQQAIFRLDEAERELGACWQTMRDQNSVAHTAAQAAQAQEYQNWLARRRDECAAALGTAERRVNVALQSVLHARQQREIVVKYFDKQKAAHLQEQVRQEQKFLDDLVGRRQDSLLAWKPTERAS